MKLDPVAARRIARQGWIITEVRPHPRPAGPRDPQIDHSRRLQVRDLAVACEQRGLIPVARCPLPERASRGHDSDELIPQRVALTIGHVRDLPRTCGIAANRGAWDVYST